MPADPLAGLFKHRVELDVPGGDAERCARQLAQRGLVRIMEHTYVRCIDPLDQDRTPALDHICSGRIYLSADRDENEGDYQCPSCERIVTPSLKRKRCSLRLLPNLDAMGAVVLGELGRIPVQADERPRGLYRVPTMSGEVQICLVDTCPDLAVFSPGYCYRQTLVYVVGNARDYARRIPPCSMVFRLVDLVLGDASQAFQRTVRRLIGDARSRSDSVSPAVLKVGSPAPYAAHGLLSPASRPGSVKVPDGTRWSQVTFYLVDGETVAIQIPLQRLRRYRPHELGMIDRRSGKPSTKWRILEALCENHGEIPWSSTATKFHAFKEQVSGLRLMLQQRLGVRDDPFPVCSRARGLRAAFRAFPVLPGAASLAETW